MLLGELKLSYNAFVKATLTPFLAVFTTEMPKAPLPLHFVAAANFSSSAVTWVKVEKSTSVLTSSGLLNTANSFQKFRRGFKAINASFPASQFLVWVSPNTKRPKPLHPSSRESAKNHDIPPLCSRGQAT
jgi:hypothetical protein